jgi:amino acid adenylation domain-containing protein
MVLLGAFEVLLFRYTNQARIVVGTPIANRNRSELEDAIGLFTNTLVLCTTLAPDMTFRQLLAEVRTTTLGAYQHQDLPFEKLVSELQPERSLSQNPLFQVLFSFQNLPGERMRDSDAPRLDEPPPGTQDLECQFSKFDLTLAMTETADGVSAVFEYATDLFAPTTIQRMADHLVNVIAHVLRHPDDPIAGFCFLSEPERTQVVVDWNDTARSWPEILPLHARFERMAREAPDAPAVIYQGTAMSYAELDRRANAVAALLRRQGIDRGAIVGICLQRSPEMVIGLFAILKAGAAYMPIEADYPADRIRYMLADAGATHVLTTSACASVVAAQTVTAIVLDELTGGEDAPPVVELAPADLAYVIFTSGSTGQPKGVMISHGAIDNRLQWMQAEYHMTPADRVMQKTPYTFDVSVWEFFWPLSVGATLIVAEPERHKESGYLVDLIQRERVTCIHFVPSMLQLFLHEDLTSCRSLRRIICSGEALTVDQCRRLQALPGVAAHNLYGPTEAAVDVTHWDCTGTRDPHASVPIGRPIANTQIYILNEKLQPAPIGVAGELHIGGHNLSRGYLNKPELTAERFIAHPFSAEPDARVYKTGDLARLRDDGDIEYIGRIDTQVKLRGLRIELGEIEAVLGAFPGVAAAAVVVHRFVAFDDRLAAYVVLSSPDAELDADAILAFAARKLPSYMVPAAITVVPELPRTTSGKLDRKRLPEPRVSRSTEPARPVNEIENTLLGMWSRVLKADGLGTTDDFFSLGGHSILVTQVINHINGHYHLDVPVRLLFENPTIRELAKALSEFEDDASADNARLTAMLMRADRRLLHTVDQLSEDQLDEVLRAHADRPELADFDEPRALLAWADGYREPAATAAIASTASTSATSPTEDANDPLGEAYVRCYLELAWTGTALLQHTLAAAAGLAPAPATTPAASGLRDEGQRIFEGYAQLVKQRLATPAGRALTPAELTACCSQILALCQLAGSLRSF